MGAPSDKQTPGSRSALSGGTYRSGVRSPTPRGLPSVQGTATPTGNPHGATGACRRGAPIPPGIPPRGPRTFRPWTLGRKVGRGPDSTPVCPLRSEGLDARQGTARWAGTGLHSGVPPGALSRDIPEGSPRPPGGSPQGTANSFSRPGC